MKILTSSRLLGGIAVAWVGWLYWYSGVLGWGYTPVPKKIALSVVAIILPAVFLMRREWLLRVTAFVLAAVTWIPIVMLWVLDKKPFGM